MNYYVMEPFPFKYGQKTNLDAMREFLDKSESFWYKEPKWVYKKEKEFIDPNGFDETLNFLNDRIDFRYTENDLIPFCPLRFKEFTQNPIIEIWVGPKNNCRASDFKLFLEKNGYDKVHFCQSQITYR